MPSHHPRSLRLGVLVALALLAASCSTGSTMAVVDGDTITRDDVFALRQDYTADAPTVDAETLRNDLSGLIIDRAIVARAEEEFGLTFSGADIAARIEQPPERYAGVFTSLQNDPGVGQALVEANALRSLVRDTVVPAILGQDYGDLATYAAERPENVAQVCVRHIMVASDAEAQDVLDRLAGGEDFEAVAAEVSLDTASPGGLLTIQGICPVFVGSLGEGFARAAATAPIGEVHGPVQTDFGVHVIRVESRVEPPTAEELAADPMQYLDPAVASAVFTPWYNEAVRTADVDVASVVGEWSPEGPGIAPPGS